MPMVIEKMAFGRLFGVIWFLLLFLAGLTTILALCQSFISFLEDSLQIPKWLSALIVVSLIFILSLPPIFWYHKGVFDDVDFWMGAFFLVIVSLSEVILFSWFFGIEKGFKELHKGAKIMIPIIFKYVIKYITPLMLIFLLVIWVITESPSYIMEANIYVWIERIIIIVTLVLLGILTYFASKKEEG
jgi:SNF family Na+-dependent transporter